ncbi:GAF domain-containing protein [Microvirga arabica]|uniref:GAF domain-containing protein n=1 Tax=Microvirga arabica TaxID=1128671 RepID=A0ABV6Y7Z1_9HYPH|nr:GAF domain-containing protein [Microvirga arabica]MBM1174264.1 GAF domain-containing protein [Microvirga arabica]
MPNVIIDRVTVFARIHFGVPICLVNLIEADQALVASKQGLDASRLDRRIAFCSYTILQPSVLVVPDARADERFKDNPVVTGEPCIRFYAGAPLVYDGEVRLGPLCLLDTKPRSFSRGEQAELQMLADQVIGVIVSRMLGLPEPDISAALSI